MKILNIALASAIIATSYNAAATTYQFIPGNDAPGTKLCVEAVSGDLRGYREKIKEYHLKDKTVANKLECNGENIANFAARYDAMNTAVYINKYRKNRVSITDLAALNAKKKDLKDTVIITIN
ncbi:DUF3718 domain-containing protein [Psychrobium sp. 1_MG-2023]|uniref:DUF3718 domain-containing protein n=1 Tax=Psychrobium sp. 1_MG-2023 TaxID=3062624 RepID=UPI0026D22512|nr:DUF3718 domain-containing protein [Psychrobium sp. 1_MG-2023]MDP2561947.1 DUF3718 domain-containing protein [Psychrobium sp. 1_MG-2023]